MSREKVGTVGVDAGIVWIGDPCYVLGDDASHKVEKWSDFCDKTFDKANERASGVSEPLGEGVGLTISSGYGDGSYPVYVERDSSGTIIRLVVEFDWEIAADDEDEDWEDDDDE